MKARLLRRSVLIAGVAFMLAFEPVPVGLSIENASGEPIRVRLDNDDPWLDVPATQTVALTSFPHAGLCRPPERWLPDYFTGVDIQRATGEETRIDRATFEKSARWGRGERWKFTVHAP